MRAADTLPWLHDLAQDLRYGWRQLRRNPGFALTAILALAIGIGANTALFGIIDQLLLRPLPVKIRRTSSCSTGSRAARACARDGRHPDDGCGERTVDEPVVLISDVPAFAGRERNARGALRVLPGGSVQRGVRRQRRNHVWPVRLGQLLPGARRTALAGRTIAASDDRLDAPPVAVITYDYWKRRFDLDPRVVGQTIAINKLPVTIVGITPPGFSGALEVPSRRT